MRFLSFFACLLLCAQQVQNPSPMVERTRPHPRLTKSDLPGKHEQLSAGTLFIPARLATRKHLPLFVHFHGAAWVAEIAAEKNGTAVIAIQTGPGSGVYAKQFSDRQLFGKLIHEAEEKSGITFDSIALTAWSAGHGAIREILAAPEYQPRINRVLLIDGMHTGYSDGHPSPMGTQQLSEVRAGRFHLIGYAGNSARDHVDQFHALPELPRLLLRL